MFARLVFHSLEAGTGRAESTRAVLQSSVDLFSKSLSKSCNGNTKYLLQFRGFSSSGGVLKMYGVEASMGISLGQAFWQRLRSRKIRGVHWRHEEICCA